MAKRDDETLRDLEETQQALRDSIEAAKGLAAHSEKLIARHRQEIAEKQSRTA